jgi:hypothetical protein
MDNRLTAQQWTSRDGGALDQGRPSRLLAEEAVRTLISWAGDDPHGRASSTRLNGWSALMRNGLPAITKSHSIARALFRGNCWLRRNRPSS